MFELPATALPAADLTQLAALQSTIDSAGSYALAVAEGKARWANKPVPLFGRIRDALASMCSGNIRCIYCEDSRGDEIEHMRPKDLYPETVFVWDNYVLACGPCNGPKNNHFAVIDARTGTLADVTRKPRAMIAAPASGQPALINPRAEDPMNLLWLDFATWRYAPNVETGIGHLRAQYTIDVLRLNTRDELVRGRRSAFSGFKARLEQYCAQAVTWTQEQKNDFVTSFRVERYRTVWLEMIRQRDTRPDINLLLTQAPDALAW